MAKLGDMVALQISSDVLKGKMSDREIMDKYGISSATYYRIKKCEGRYSWLCKKENKVVTKKDLMDELGKLKQELKSITNRITEIEKQIQGV